MQECEKAAKDPGEELWIPSSIRVLQMMVTLALFGPLFFYLDTNLDAGPIFYIHSLFWQLDSLGGPFVLIFGFTSAFWALIPLRLFFALQMKRCYDLQTSKFLTVLVGALCEFPSLVALGFLPIDPLSPFLIILSPIPLLLLVGLLLLVVTPPRKASHTWNE
ncbi:MAG: hypothetical protein E4H14_00460 [Candidatus Thorarchaeota archaeon]|nr:MAG: hypothetical protein E4H14_00460 [Candidatus Thorarchaeota archaeon]